ncbi:hypothetical protein ACSNOI_07385 [Actinomadura kijaniata]|uniref:hypothetical protein n=1 Tax=Actinomadura kijaniata TaxID=46161 RepID=UPI003F1B1CAC
MVIRILFSHYGQLEERGGARVSLAAPRTGLIVHTPRFDTVLKDLSRMPGGNRRPAPGHRAVPMPAILVLNVVAVLR